MMVHSLVNVAYISGHRFSPKPVILKCIRTGLSADLKAGGNVILISALGKMNRHPGSQDIAGKKISLVLILGAFFGMPQHNMSQLMHNGEPDPKRRLCLIIGNDPVGTVAERVLRIISAVFIEPLIDVPHVLIRENPVSVVS